MEKTVNKAKPHDGLFSLRRDDDDTTYIPSRLAGGPWNPSHQHGGPVAGLLSRALHKIESPVPMRLARITVEMFRGVPMTPLRIETRVLRAGRRIQSVEANLFDKETQVARATGLRIRLNDALSNIASAEIRDPMIGEPPTQIPPHHPPAGFDDPAGFGDAVDFVRGEQAGPGQLSTLWVRLRCRLIDDEEIPAIVRLACIADFASGTGNDMDYTKYTAINPDLTIHVIREPRSDWIGIHAISRRAQDGIGQSAATLYDLDGPVANVQASLLLDQR